MLVSVTGCGNDPVKSTPTVVLTMNFTPPLRPFGTVFQACTRMQPGLSLLVNELSASQITYLPADIFLTWGPADIPDRKPYQTGSEELVFIVNRDNPAISMSQQQLESILSGKFTTWNSVLQPECPDCAADSPEKPIAETTIEIWSYPDFEETFIALQSFPGGINIPKNISHIAPDSEAMLLSISQNFSAIGYIPRRWLDDRVKIIEILDLSQESLNHPILAYPKEPLNPVSSSFISCLQNVLNP